MNSSTEHQLAKEYFSPLLYRPSAFNSEYNVIILPSQPFGYWTFDHDDAAILWPTEKTACFLAELREVFLCLGTTNAPPLSAIIIILAATRSDAEHHNTVAFRTFWKHANYLCPNVISAPTEAIPGPISDVLQLIQALPEHLRKSVAAKAELISLAAEAAKATLSTVPADQLLTFIDHGIIQQLIKDFQTNYSLEYTIGLEPLRADIKNTIDFFKSGFESMTTETLVQLLQTGLPAAPNKINIEVPFFQQALNFLKSAADIEAHAGIAAISLDLLPAVKLPRKLSLPQQMPLGGVTDITNRGTFDRLLISELANDDLALATRLALNEALYLRREAPPQHPSRQRRVLLDCGLRMWGTPRVFAASVALALAATTDHGARADVYLANGQRPQSINILSTNGLNVLLSTLTHHLDASAALPHFLDARDTPECDRIIVTADDSLADELFQQNLYQNLIGELFIIAVNREGRLQLYLQTQHTRSLIRESQVSLDQLFCSPKASASLIDSTVQTDLPAIMKRQAFPFELPAHGSSRFTWSHFVNNKEFVLTLTHDGRLLERIHREGSDCYGYGKQLIDGLAGLGLVHASLIEDDILFVVLGSSERDRLLVLTYAFNNQRRSTNEIQLKEPFRKNGVSVYRNVIFVVTDTGIFAYDLKRLTQLAIRSLPDNLVSHHSRFLLKVDYGSFIWQAMSWNGTNIELTNVNLNSEHATGVKLIFDWPGSEGLYVFEVPGSIYSADTAESVKYQIVPKQAAKPVVTASKLSLCQRFIGYSVDGHPNNYVISLESMKESAGTHKSIYKCLYQHIKIPREGRGLHSRFAFAAVQSASILCLVRKNMSTEQVTFNRDAKTFSLVRGSFSTLVPHVVFSKVSNDSRIGYSLFLARFSDGSHIWLDTRGLLHARSSDKRLPEFSLVLPVQGNVAGWIDDGRMFFDNNSFGGDTSRQIATREFFKEIWQPFLARLEC